MTIIKKRSNGSWRTISGAPASVVAPGAPSGVSATSPTSGVLLVSWTAPASTGNGDITQYEIRAIPVGGGSTVIVHANPLDTQTLVLGLVAGTAYNCVVLASTSAGQGPASTASSQVTVTAATTYILPSGTIIPSGWVNPKTAGIFGAGLDYGTLTPYQGNLTTSSNGQIIQNLDIRGNITIRHNNVTIRRCRVRSVQTSNTLVGGESVIDGNQSTVDGGGNRTWLANNLTVSYCEVIGSLDPNLNDQSGVTNGGGTALTTDHCVLHDVSDAITPSDQSITTSNCVYDMKVANGSHADCYQITDGDSALVQDNVFIGFVPGTVPVTGGDGVQRIAKDNSVSNSAIQIGAQTGTLTNITINHNYLSGGIYTINSNNTGESTYGNITGAYTNNVFSGYYHYGPVANYGSGMTFDNTNVWEATRVTNAWAGAGDSIEVYWHTTGGGPVNGTVMNTTP